MGGSESGEKRLNSKPFNCMLLVVFSALFIQPLFSENHPLRSVTVKIAADHRLKADGTWKIDSRRSLKAVSDIFTKEFGLEFQIEDYEYWHPDINQKIMGRKRNFFWRQPRMRPMPLMGHAHGFLSTLVIVLIAHPMIYDCGAKSW